MLLFPQVLSSCSDGKIPLTDFSMQYEKVCNKPLLPASYGYSTVLSLVDDMVDTVNITRVEKLGDYIISLKSDSPRSAKSSHSG